MGVLDPPSDGIAPTLLDLGEQEGIEIAEVGLVLAVGLLGEATALGPDGW